MRWIMFALLLGACSEANHLGNPLLLPVSGAVTAVENATYAARRARVSEYLSQHRLAVQQQALAGGGADLDMVAQLARVSAASRGHMIRDLAEISVSPPPDWVERATVIAMVHGI